MDDIKFDEVISGKMTEIDKKLAAIFTCVKAKENQSTNQEIFPTASKEEIETIVKEKVTVIGNYIELRLKQQTEQQTKILTAAINKIDSKIENLSKSGNVLLEPIMKMFPQPKKIAFFGFEFLKTSFVIFILSIAVFWSLTINIKQMDNYRALKTQLYQQTEYIMKIQKSEKTKK